MSYVELWSVKIIEKITQNVRSLFCARQVITDYCNFIFS